MVEKIFEEIIENYQKTNDIYFDIENLLNKYQKQNIFVHSKKVSEKAVELAYKFGVNIEKIKIASYLHDISGIIKDIDKIAFSEFMNIEIIDEERLVPMILHQKISKEIAEKVFDINDNEILQAISCHTTLNGNPSKFDMVLFISDKIEWDQLDKPPYLDIILENLNKSLEKGVEKFIEYLLENKHTLKIIHPWLIEAYNYFQYKKEKIIEKPNST
jgi:predicted HD superfamily hydrolase involved in NAD metabolism